MLDTSKIKEGKTKVRVIKLYSIRGMIANPEYILNRRKGVEGIILEYLPGHGGDVWRVKHHDGKEAVYSFTELVEIT